MQCDRKNDGKVGKRKTKMPTFHGINKQNKKQAQNDQFNCII